MNKTEVAKLLTVASGVDNRKVTPEVVEVWFPILGYLDFEPSLEALKLHFAETTDWLLPAHIIRNVARVKRDRLPLNAIEAAARECPMHAGYPLPCLRCEAF